MKRFLMHVDVDVTSVVSTCATVVPPTVAIIPVDPNPDDGDDERIDEVVMDFDASIFAAVAAVIVDIADCGSDDNDDDDATIDDGKSIDCGAAVDGRDIKVGNVSVVTGAVICGVIVDLFKKLSFLWL